MATGESVTVNPEAPSGGSVLFSETMATEKPHLTLLHPEPTAEEMVAFVESVTGKKVSAKEREELDELIASERKKLIEQGVITE